MIGPRNCVVREMLGETVPLEDWLTDQSEFIDGGTLRRQDVPEVWAHLIHDYVHVEESDV